MEYLFGLATGWLGWPPGVAWRATIHEIEAAWKAKKQFLRCTVQGFAEMDDEMEEAKKVPSTVKYGEVDRAAVAEKTRKLFGMFRQAKQPATQR